MREDQPLRLGRYEAAASALLYEFDPAVRRKMKARELAADRSFGASLRRLRLQRGLARADFPGVAEKSIARIERGEVERPHARNLTKIARALDVSPEEISDY